jgi:hypothetical protein
LKRVLLCIPAIFMIADSYAQPIIKIRGMEYSISSDLDSVYIKGLENVFSFELPKNKYVTDRTFRYQLKGSDQNWIQSEYPTARYVNLKGGEYTFSYQVGNAEINEIKVSVSEVIWQKWWFWPMVAAYIVILIGVGMFLFFQYNYRQKIKIQYIRNKLASDLHDEVGSNLSSIAIYTEVLKKRLSKTSPDLIPLLDNITGNSKESVVLMQDTVWALNPKNDDLETLIYRIIHFGSEILTAKGISFSHTVDIQPNKIKLDMESRKNCYMIMKEAINNVAKHSQATHATLSIHHESYRVCFELIDNGIGFNQDVETRGNGLKNYKERSDESEFQLIINSDAKKDTSIKLLID